MDIVQTGCMNYLGRVVAGLWQNFVESSSIIYGFVSPNIKDASAELLVCWAFPASKPSHLRPSKTAVR